MTKKAELKVLKLTLAGGPFNVMATGEKRTEYRKPSDWIASRLMDPAGQEKDYDMVEFRNGYGPDVPMFMAHYYGFTRAIADYSMTYSNGLAVAVKKGDFKIHLGPVTLLANVKQKA
jgi:hypothetical protein